MIISTSCRAGVCLDAEAPVSLKALKLYRWAESDKEFLKNLTMNKKQVVLVESCGSSSSSSSSSGCKTTSKEKSYSSSPSSSSEYSSSSSPSSLVSAKSEYDQIQRQRYLRSYTFNKKETAAEKTKKYWTKEKQKLKKKMNINCNSYGKKKKSASSCFYIMDVVFAFFFMSVVKVDVHDS